jgi:hypothetical protein
MSQQCPRCGRTLDFPGAPLSFCGFCGASLRATTPPADPDITLAPVVNSSSDSIPERLGEYRLLRCLGRGGMGVVYEGEHETTGRRVAVKLIDIAASPDAVERFRREGKLAASVTHPRCVFVLAVDEDAGRHYIVMELMPGQTLDDLIREQGPLPVGRAIDLTLDLIEGLEQIHGLGVIHRDVKPSNCFLDEQGRVKVGDFGLARSLASNARLTRTGTFVGTPLFAAPEQILSQPLDVRADVYSACATLWFLLTGRAPHETGDSDAMAALARVVSDDPPPLRSLRPELPPGLERLLSRGLARDHQQRLPDLAALAGNLRAFRPLPADFHLQASRATAYLLDQALLAIAASLIALASGDSLARDSTWTENIFVALVSAVCFGLCEGFTGLSPGKWLLGLRVWRNDDVGPPGFWRALLRALLCEMLLLGLDLPSSLVDAEMYPLGSIGVFLFVVAVSLVLLLSTARRQNGYRCLHDVLSGTRVVLAPATVFNAPFAIRPPVPVADVPAAPSRLGPYRIEGAFWTGEDCLLKGSDEGLERPVWIWERPTECRALLPARQQLIRPTRPRWLADGEQHGRRWDAFVAPAGGPLVEVMQTRSPLDWEEARGILDSLAEEMTLADTDGTLPAHLSLSQVWVAPGAQVQLLDCPFPHSRCLTPLDLLAEVAVLLLEGQPRGDASPPRAPIPLFARELLEDLPRFGGSLQKLAAFHGLLAACRDRPGRVTQAIRGPLLTLFALMAVLPMLMGLGAMSGFRFDFVRSLETLATQSDRLVLERQRQEAVTGATLVVQVSHPLASLVGTAMLADQQAVTSRLERGTRDARRYARERRKSMSRIDRWFLDQLREGDINRLNRDDSSDQILRINTLDYGFREQHWSVKAMAFPALMLTPVLCMLSAVLFRGGLRHYLLGVRLVRRDGRRAGRLRCAWRALMAWSMLIPLGLWLLLEDFAWRHRIAYLGDLCWGASALLALLLMAVMLRTPARSFHDRLAGTWLVPR